MFEVAYHTGRWKEFDWYLLWQEGARESIVYAPNLGVVLSVTDRVRRYVTKNSTLPSVIERHFQSREEHATYPIVERPKAFHLAMGLTRNCTLFCDYCHAEADKDVRTGRGYIDTAIEHAFKCAGATPRRILSVSFAVGGEPTMNWPEFTYTVDRIRELESVNHHDVERVYISMTTNCYYGVERRRYVEENLDKLTLSLDGDQDVQDKHRPTRSGKGSYKLIAETVKHYLNSVKVDAGIRATVSDYSVKKLIRIIDEFYREFGNGYTVALEPLVPVGRGQVGFFGPPTNREFGERFWEAREHGRNRGIRVITSAANIDRLVGRYCGAMSIPSFTLCSNGSLTACHRDQEAEDYGYGFIDGNTGEIVIDEQRVAQNVAKTEIKDGCERCPVKWHCAGDCPDLRNAGFNRCDVNIYLMFQQLTDRLSERRLTH